MSVPPVFLLNSLVIPCAGTYEAQEITAADARYLAGVRGTRSFVRHDGSARLFAELLGTPVTVTRERYRAQVGDIAIGVRLNLPRGVIPQEWSLAEVRAMGFVLFRIDRIA